MIRFKMKLLILILFSACLTAILYSGSLTNQIICENCLYENNDVDIPSSDRYLLNKLRIFSTSFDNFSSVNYHNVSRLNLTSRLRQIIDVVRSEPINFISTNQSLSARVKSTSFLGVNKSVSQLVDIMPNINSQLNTHYMMQDFDTANRFINRRVVALNECSSNKKSYETMRVKKDKLEHILVDTKHKVLLCYVPKVACTNWKRMFLLLTGKFSNATYVNNLPGYEVHNKSLFYSLQNFTEAEIEIFVNNYTKIMFVRNPLERLLSAYKNKLEQHYNSSKYFQSRFGTFIVKTFRKNPSNSSIIKGDDVTFEEFVKYLVSSEKDQYNEHWQTVNDLCYPCILNYDFIGKYETLMEDSNAILKMLGANFSFPTIPKPSRTASNMHDYYRRLPKDLIRQLYNIYEYDFRIFNYDLGKTLNADET